MHTGGEMEPTIYRIIASSIEAATDDASGPHTLLIALSIDFHLHYLDALKHKLLMIAATMSLSSFLSCCSPCTKATSHCAMSA